MLTMALFHQSSVEVITLFTGDLVLQNYLSNLGRFWPPKNEAVCGKVRKFFFDNQRKP